MNEFTRASRIRWGIAAVIAAMAVALFSASMWIHDLGVCSTVATNESRESVGSSREAAIGHPSPAGGSLSGAASGSTDPTVGEGTGASLAPSMGSSATSEGNSTGFPGDGSQRSEVQTLEESCHPFGIGEMWPVLLLIGLLILPDLTELGIGNLLVLKRVDRRIARRTSRIFERKSAAVGSVVDTARATAAQMLLGDLLEPGSDSVLRGCELDLYLHDEDVGLLAPMRRPGRREAEKWLPGDGVIGHAWSTGELVYVESGPVHNAARALPEDRQMRLAQLTPNVAAPVVNAEGRTIAVLAATTGEEVCCPTSDEAVEEMLAIAELVARVLVDLLRWNDDDA